MEITKKDVLVVIFVIFLIVPIARIEGTKYPNECLKLDIGYYLVQNGVEVLMFCTGYFFHKNYDKKRD